jgi:hypothetical protein
VGTLGTLGNWPTSTAQEFYRVNFPATNASFEILAMRSRQNGVEIQFSQAIDPATAVAGSFSLGQWRMQRQDGYGAGNNTETVPAIGAVQVSSDNLRVFLQIGNNAATDRLLRVTAGGIRSASGGVLVHNQVWLAHNYQSTAPFNPGVRVADRVDAHLKNSISYFRPFPGRVTVKSDLAGTYRISLRSLDGRSLDERKGAGPSEFTFAPGGSGIFVLQVTQGERSYSRPLSL